MSTSPGKAIGKSKKEELTDADAELAFSSSLFSKISSFRELSTRNEFNKNVQTQQRSAEHLGAHGLLAPLQLLLHLDGLPLEELSLLVTRFQLQHPLGIFAAGGEVTQS